jgi:phasin family protein
MADQNNPFKNFDFQSLFANAKLPGFDMEGCLAAQKKNVEALVGANQAVAEGYQAVAKRQAEILQGTIQEAQARMNALMSSGTPEDQVAKQAEVVKAALEQATVNMQELSDLVQKSQAEAYDILNRRMAEGMDEIKDNAKT